MTHVHPVDATLANYCEHGTWRDGCEICWRNETNVIEIDDWNHENEGEDSPPSEPPPTAQDGAEHGKHQPDSLTHGQLRSIPLGRRMARERLRGRFLYATGLGWHEWDGARWRQVEDDRDNSRMMAVAADWAERFIITLIRSGADSKTVGYALRYRDVGMVRQLLAGAKTDRSILVESATLDARPGLLNCTNGTVDLRTGELRRHDPADLITKTTGVAFDVGAVHPDWNKALVALPDGDAARWLQVQVGSAASGEPDRSGPVVFHYGDGANGKSTIVNALIGAFGDYCAKVPDRLLASTGHDHDEIWMPLRGARLAYLEELPEDHALPVARIKKLSETGELDGRPIGGHRIRWAATHSLIVSTNYLPLVAESDHGTWRRLVMVAYPHTFSGDARDGGLRRRVRTSMRVRQAVLAWIVVGAVEWYANGQELPELPESIAAATRTWRTDNDVIAGFLLENVEFTGDEADRIATTAMQHEFNEQLGKGSRPWSLKKFSGRLKSHYLIKERSLGVDRGVQNREPMAVVGAAWKGQSHHAQAPVGDF